MKLVKRLIALAWMLTILAVGCVLYLFNSDSVVLDLVWMKIPPTSLAVVLIATFFAGIMTGTILVVIALMGPEKQKSIE